MFNFFNKYLNKIYLLVICSVVANFPSSLLRCQFVSGGLLVLFLT